MKKIRSIFIAAALAASITALAGCSSKEQNVTPTESPVGTEAPAKTPETADSTAVPTSEPDGPDSEADKLLLEQLSSLIGMSDSDAISLLGQGDIEPEEGEDLVVREYKKTLFGEEATINVNFEADTVYGVTIYLLGDKVEPYEKQMTEQMGKYNGSNSDANGEEGSGLVSYTYAIGNNTMELKQAYGSVSIEIFKAEK